MSFSKKAKSPTQPRAFCNRRRLLALLTPVFAIQSMGLTAFESVWPKEWFEPAMTASQLGIKRFYESPVLSPDLPLITQRLPNDPVVIVPLDSIGSYGGTARIIAEDLGMLFGREGLFIISADHKTILPNLAKSWHYSEDGRTLTVNLREGLKWSDGHSLTADDFLFATNDLLLNTQFLPNTPSLMRGLTLQAKDALTLVYGFPEPRPLFINFMAQSPELFMMPKHYFAAYHPRYTTPDTLKQRLDKIGFLNWSTFITNTGLQQRRIPELANQPSMGAFVPVSLTPSVSRYERNPYYFKIDPHGQQLPYIDAIDAEDVRDNAVAVAKASTGQLDFAGIRMPTQDIPLLKLGESNSGIKVNIWRRLHGNDVVIQANFNHANAKLRSLFWDIRFRRALSLAINRDEMNEIIYFGRGVPRQVTVIPESDYFEPYFATAYANFDLAAAHKLLDDMGLKDVDGDGLREYPDGSRLTLTVEFVATETPKQISMELVISYWKAVGIDVRLKQIDRGLQYARAIAGKMEMTVWHADRTTDILFPISPDFWVPRKLAASLSMWNQWSLWYMSNGHQGEKPPAEIRDLQAWADQLATSMDPAQRVRLGKKILGSNADNVWTIGTIGLAPHPVVISDRLKNVVERGLWGWDTRWTSPYHPATWFLAK
ncbi:MAG: ABC transporter substrate-binding protein [Pseudomonadota bacterium]